MNWNNLSKEDASKYARRAQWAFVAIGVGAAGFAAVGSRSTQSPAVSPLTIPAPAQPGPAEPQNGPTHITFNPKAVADRFGLVANHPKPAALQRLAARQERIP